MDYKFDQEVTIDDVKRMDIDEQLACIYFVLRDRNEIKYPIDGDPDCIKFIQLYKSIKVERLYKDDYSTLESDKLREIAKSLVCKPAVIKHLEHTNPQLTILVLELLDLKSGDIIFDLGASYGNFLVGAHDYADRYSLTLKDYCGIELNGVYRVASKFLFAILNYEFTKVKEGDAFKSFPYKYSKGYCFPPLGLRVPGAEKIVPLTFNFAFNNNVSSEWIFIDRLVDGLISDESKAVCLCREGLFFREIDKRYRDYLLDKGYIESIIELPGGTLNFSGIRPILLVLSKKYNKTVNVCDASDVIEGKYKFINIELPVEKVREKFASSKVYDAKYLINAKSIVPSTIIPGDDVKLEGTPLNVNAKIIVGSQYTSKNFSSMFTKEPTGYRILTSSDIDEGMVDWNHLQFIDYKDTKFDKFAVIKGDVVITSKSSKVKTVVVDIEPKEKILVTGGMMIIRPDQAKINPTYLKIYLDSTKGQIALKRIQNGTTIVSFNAKDLETILIPDVPKEQQDELAKKYNSKLSSYLALKQELERIKAQLEGFLNYEEE